MVGTSRHDEDNAWFKVGSAPVSKLRHTQRMTLPKRSAALSLQQFWKSEALIAGGVDGRDWMHVLR